MPKLDRTFDVFVVHAPGDVLRARNAADALRQSGLDAFVAAELPAGTDVSSAVWQALAECSAVLTILPPSGPSASMGIEIGAARAWQKPIVVLVTDPAQTHLPLGLGATEVYPWQRLDDAIAAIKAGMHPLSAADQTLLARLYMTLGASVDELAFNPKDLDELTSRFKAQAGKNVAGERLLAELLRMRKQGQLVKRRHTTPASAV